MCKQNSEATGEKIRGMAEEWHEQCKMLPSYKTLSKDARKNFSDIAVFFAEMMHLEHEQAPSAWTAAVMQELLTKTYPHKVLSPPSYFVAVGAILPVLFGHLEQSGVINARKAQALNRRLETAVPAMLRQTNDRPGGLVLKKSAKPQSSKTALEMQAGEQVLGGKRATDVVKKALEKLVNAPAYMNPAEAYMANKAALEAPQGDTPVMLEQWERLYEVTKNIRLIAPWEYLHESERIALLLPGRDEPVYIVVMGSGKMTYGIGIFPGYDALNRLRRMEDGENDADDMDMTVAFEQNCINLYFGDRDELEPQDMAVIKKLGLKFRGHNEWPYFRSMKPGFMPWYLNRDEAELTIAALQNFAMAFVAYQKQVFEVDFDEGETLLRFYDAEADMWYNTGVRMPPVPVIQPKLIVSDDDLIARLSKKKKTRAELGFAVTYMPAPFQESETERPRVPLVATLTDMSDGKPIEHISDMEAESESQTFSGAVIEMLSSYIGEHGRPASIAVSEKDRCYVADFAEKLGVKLVEDERLAMLGGMMIKLMDMIDSGQIDIDSLKDLMGDFTIK